MRENGNYLTDDAIVTKHVFELNRFLVASTVVEKV
jgi:hypothetical protein